MSARAKILGGALLVPGSFGAPWLVPDTWRLSVTLGLAIFWLIAALALVVYCRATTGSWTKEDEEFNREW